MLRYFIKGQSSIWHRFLVLVLFYSKFAIRSITVSINLNDYISCGYFVIKPYKRPNNFAVTLPETVLSLAIHVCDHFPPQWAIPRNEMPKFETCVEEAKKFGIDKSKVKELLKWVDKNENKVIGWPDICPTLAVAKMLKHKFISDDNDAVILGASLHKSLKDEVLEALEPTEPKSWWDMSKTLDICGFLNLGKPPAAGKVLGFEPTCIGYDGGHEHSWLCHGYDEVIKEKLGIKVNQNGFINTYEDVLKCDEYINSDEAEPEPGIWAPWLVIQY